MNIGHHLLSKEVHSSSMNGKKIYSVLVLLWLLYEQRELGLDDVSMLFSMLRLKHDIEPYKFEDLRFLQSMFTATVQDKIADILIHFINLILPNRDVCMECQWLHVIPLVHIFKRTTQPFASLYEKEIIWMDNNFNLFIVKQNMSIQAPRYCMHGHSELLTLKGRGHAGIN